MNVIDLFEVLKGEVEAGNGKLEVHIAFNYGDHWNTTVAPKVQNADVFAVTYSDYHNMDKLVMDETGEDEREAFVISNKVF